MKITEMLQREFVLEDLKARNKRDALAELVGVFAKGRSGQSRCDASYPPGAGEVGEHRHRGRYRHPPRQIPGLDEMVVSFGRSREGIAFEAMDGKPVHLFFLLMAPENSAGQHLKVLAKISRMLKDLLSGKFLEAKMHEEQFRIIAEKDEK